MSPSTTQPSIPINGPGTSAEDHTTPDHHSDSGIGFGSDTEMQVSLFNSRLPELSFPVFSPLYLPPRQLLPAINIYHQQIIHPEPHPTRREDTHTRSRSLPQPLPLFRPPPPISRSPPLPQTTPREPLQQSGFSRSISATGGGDEGNYQRSPPLPQRFSSRAHARAGAGAGFSIHSVLATPGVEGQRI